MEISISQGVIPNEVDGNCDRIFAFFEKRSRHFISVLVNFVNCSYNVTIVNSMHSSAKVT